MVYCLILVLLAKPIDLDSSQLTGRLVDFSLNLNGKDQVIGVVILAATNVITDVLSLAITYSHINKISELHCYSRNFLAILVAIKDIIYAFMLFLLSQIISNILYPLSIENPPQDFDPFSIEAALMPYAFVYDASGKQVQFYDFIFPGQLFITGTVFAPTCLVMLLVLTLGFLSGILKFIHYLQAKVINDHMLLEILHPTGSNDLALKISTRTKKCIAFAINVVIAIFTSLVASLIFLFLHSLF